MPKGNLDGPRQSFAIGADDQISPPNPMPASSSPTRTARGAAWATRQRDRQCREFKLGAGTTTIGGHSRRAASARRQHHHHVDKIRELLPRLKASPPPAIKVDILHRPHGDIRASIREVQFTLVLTVGLVVLVIPFLRKFWRTVIPSVTLPVSLVATSRHAAPGFSLDICRWMALTIAAGLRRRRRHRA